MTGTTGIDETQPLRKGDPRKEARAVFLPEERTPRLTWQQNLARRLHMDNDYARVSLSEFLGTFVLVAIGVGSVAQEQLSEVLHPYPNFQHGNIVTIQIGWGMAVAMGVFVSGGASGGHINPAVTLAFAVLGRLPWKKVPFYIVSQYLGAIFASLCVYIVYFDALNQVDRGIRNESTMTIWSTFPAAHTSIGQGLADQIFATGMLVLLVMAITDEKNMNVPKGLVPIAIGFAVLVLLASFELNCGAALNPARDLGPRIFTAMAGWKSLPFAVRNYGWFWVPVVGPHIGAILGAWLYNICVGLHWPEPDTYRYRA